MHGGGKRLLECKWETGKISELESNLSAFKPCMLILDATVVLGSFINRCSIHFVPQLHSH